MSFSAQPCIFSAGDIAAHASTTDQGSNRTHPCGSGSRTVAAVGRSRFEIPDFRSDLQIRTDGGARFEWSPFGNVYETPVLCLVVPRTISTPCDMRPERQVTDPRLRTFLRSG